MFQTNENKVCSLGAPYGWFGVMRSEQLANGDVKEVIINQERIVVFRDESGRVNALEAYCPHLGAHLAHGGTVVGQSVRCPFHAWHFSGDGALTSIGDGACTKSGLLGQHVMRSYPADEVNGSIWVWFAPEGMEPQWSVPVIEELNSGEWTEPVLYEREVKAHIQDLIENGIDSAHFPIVHGTLGEATSSFGVDGHVMHGYQETVFKSSKGDVVSRLTIELNGPGCGISRFSGLCEMILVGTYVPVAPDLVRFQFLFSEPKAQAKKTSIGTALISNVIGQQEEDVPIWENKIYRARPLLSALDGPINKYRKWFSQFFVEELEPVNTSRRSKTLPDVIAVNEENSPIQSVG